MNFETLRVVQDGVVLRVELNRPEQLNAMSRQMVTDLRDIFMSLNQNKSVRVVLLTGVGRHFCAGLDLKESQTSGTMSDVSDQLNRQKRFAEIYIAMRRCPQPIISLIQGAASGGGMALALSSDIRLLTHDARLNAAFIRVGLSGCDMGVSYFLPRLVGAGIASELLLTGRFLKAERALQLGLASAIGSYSEMEAEAKGLIEDMLRATPLGLRLTKDALNQSIDAAGLEAVMAIEDRNQMLALQDQNFSEGISAFLEKRSPNYV